VNKFLSLTTIALASVAAPAIAAPVQFELGIGTSTYSTLADGIWYQQGLSHNLRLQVPAITAGITGAFHLSDHWSADWHADYIYLGSVHSDAMAVPDANYSVAKGACISQCNAGNQSRFVGNGNVNGLALTIGPTLRFGEWHAGAEAGAFLFRSTWRQTIYPAGGGEAVHANYTPHLQVKPVVGLSVGVGNFDFTLRYFADRSAWNPYPTIWKGTTLLSTTYRW
jgi:hypothetical protein